MRGNAFEENEVWYENATIFHFMQGSSRAEFQLHSS